MLLRFVIINILMFVVCHNVKALTTTLQVFEPSDKNVEIFFQPGVDEVNDFWGSLNKQLVTNIVQNIGTENKRVTAAVLTLTLGMLGVHRIYLGTAPYIPAVYLFTFGGGFFVLPVIDLVMILTTKDISSFENNNKLLMWIKE
ncbi:MAG: TM2 domain-containing protein [Bacteroidia bacterium]|nr:TM2 domain-containing protein [Bacteroidia bacterium]